MRASVLQMSPGADRAANMAGAAALIARAARAGARLAALPEMWGCLGGDRAARLAAAETLPGPGGAGGPLYEFLAASARAHGLTLHGGSIAEREGDRLFNTTLVFGPDGREIARYRKIHLFDIVSPDGAGYRESAHFGAGDAVATFQADGHTVGCAICYDLRFPELFRALRRRGADTIVLPAAFTLHTGIDHWEVLLRARAIETQCWLLAPATTGRHFAEDGAARDTFGHSLACDPWGQVLARAGNGVGLATVEIDPAVTDRVRRDMPLLDHARLG